MASLRNLKKMNNKTKTKVFCYVSNFERNNNLFMVIPMMIIYGILQFCFDDEYFDKCGNGIILKKRGVARNPRINGEYDSKVALGKVWIESSTTNQIATWKFIVKGKGSHIVTFGLISNQSTSYRDYYNCYGFSIHENEKGSSILLKEDLRDRWNTFLGSTPQRLRDTSKNKGNEYTLCYETGTETNLFGSLWLWRNELLLMTIGGFGGFGLRKGPNMKYKLKIKLTSTNTIIRLKDFNIVYK